MPASPINQYPEKILPPWQIERAALFHRICLGVLNRMAKGKTFASAIRWYSWYYDGSPYRSAPKLKRHCGKGTLISNFYKWKKSGKTPEVFFLTYSSANKKLKPAHAAKFMKLCLRSNVCSYSWAHLGMRNPIASVEVYRNSLPVEMRRLITRLFLQRRSARWTERKARIVLEDFQIA
ncbi:MAG: hypothetical protein U1F65_05135 [Verrucomicrobiota bacterium]